MPDESDNLPCTDLSFVTTKELVEEFGKRSECLLIGHVNHQGRVQVWHGGSYVVLRGLMEVLKDDIRRAHRKAQEEQS